MFLVLGLNGAAAINTLEKQADTHTTGRRNQRVTELLLLQAAGIWTCNGTNGLKRKTLR
jgi:hypothetical protein